MTNRLAGVGMVLPVLAAGLLFAGFSRHPTSAANTAEKTAVTAPAAATTVSPARRSVTRKACHPEATRRLAKGPQILTSVFEATGMGLRSNLGLQKSCKYFLTSTVKSKSTVSKVEQTGRGHFEVTEIREFLEVRDQLRLFEPDVGLAICDTLPIDKLVEWTTGISSVLSALDGGTTLAATHETERAIRAIDGVTLRGVLGKFNVQIPENIEAWVTNLANEYAGEQLTDVRRKIHHIEGKSYKIVYLQDAAGAPLQVDFMNVDGSPIPDDEWDILKLANVFIDAQVIPDERVQPGDKWQIDAETLAGLVDPAAQGGSCVGQISVERQDDLPGGNWKLHFAEAKIRTKSAGGATAGVFTIKDGNAVGDAESASVKSMQIRGTGRLATQKSERWAVFELMTKMVGDCEYRAVMTAERVK